MLVNKNLVNSRVFEIVFPNIIDYWGFCLSIIASKKTPVHERVSWRISRRGLLPPRTHFGEMKKSLYPLQLMGTLEI
jgi:hypothetical protein